MTEAHFEVDEKEKASVGVYCALADVHNITDAQKLVPNWMSGVLAFNLSTQEAEASRSL